FAQLRLEAPVVAARDDRFVLRTGTTIGGGRILDPAPPRHASLERMERAARGEIAVDAPVLIGGEWRYSDDWLAELRAEIDERLTHVDPLDPGIPAPPEAWLDAVLPALELERRGAKLYRPGALPELADRAADAAALEAQLGPEPSKVDDAP